MSDIIHLLSDDLANKIAAGEVVVRPAAVVKELLENSIDAGATSLQLIIKDGGKSLIQVIDNGSGMSSTDARMSFERHATSKIKQENDLFSINTMGFRGEALASIAAVAKVDLKTKLEEDSLGTQIIIEGSKLISHEACQTTKGTNLAVKSLFYNVPARRKFLKSDSVETKHIIEEFVRISLAHPNVKMVMINNEKEVYHLPEQTLPKRITQIFGKKYDGRIIEIEENTDIVNISGYIGKPEFCKKSKGEQYFFVNNRFIKSHYLNHAIMRAYVDFIDPKEYPLYVVYLEIDPTKIDINVHPSKHEIKFEDEKHIYTILSAAVRHALSKFSVIPTLDFNADPTFNRHEFFGQKTENLNIDNQTSKGGSSSFMKRTPISSSPKAKQEDWEQLYTFSPKEEQTLENIAKSQPVEQQQSFAEQVMPTELPKQLVHEQVVSEQKFSQVLLRYILVEDGKGFLLIDQRRAHQRILYEQFLHSMNNQKFPSQKMLFPETIELSASDFAIFQSYKDEIESLGFEIEHFGQTTIIVQACPTDLTLNSIEDFIQTLMAEMSHPTDETLNHQERIAKHLALYGAIRHGQTLNQTQMQSIFQQLMQTTQPNYGIRKDKTLLKYTVDQLNKAFSI